MSEQTQRRLVLFVLFVAMGLVVWLVARNEAAPIVPAEVDWSNAEMTTEAATHAAPPRPKATTAANAEAEKPTANEDGVIEVQVVEAGLPIIGATVELFLRGERDPNTAEQIWTKEGSGATALGGAWRIPARAGQYLVSATTSGAAGAFSEVRHPQGEKLTLVRLELKPGVVLTGRTLMHGTGEPVPLAQIVGTPRIVLGASGEVEWLVGLQVRAQSDSRGQFSVSGLVPGAWRFEASAPGAGHATARPMMIPSATPLVLELLGASYLEGHVVSSLGKPVARAEVAARGAARSEHASSSEAGAFSIEVSPGPWTLSARHGVEAGVVPHKLAVAEGQTLHGIEIVLGPAAAIVGNVVHRGDNAGISGARVSVSPHDEDGDSGRAVSGPVGEYAVTGLAPGSYDVVVEADGFRGDQQRGISLAAGQRFELRFALSGTGSVEGTVRDRHGHPLEGAIVESEPVGESPASSARTGGDGTYHLGRVPVGHSVITARRNGAVRGTTQGVSVREGETGHADFSLAETGRLTGRVTRAVGALPEGGVGITVTPQPEWSVFDPPMTTQLAADGSYSFELPAGTYGVEAQSQNPLLVSSSDTISIEGGATVTHDLVLADQQTQSTLRVQVLEPGGAPSPKASVSIIGGNGGRGAFRAYCAADANGQCSVNRPTGDATGTLNIDASNGARSGSISVPASAGEATVPLRPAASLHGKLVGDPAATAFTLNVIPLAPGLSPTDPSVAIGSGSGGLQFVGNEFSIDEVPVGTLRLHAQTSDGRGGDATATTSSGETSNVQIVLASATSLIGRAVDAKGAPIAGAHIALDRASHTSADGSGAFRFDSIAPGAHHLTGSAEPQLSANQDVQVAQGQQLDLGDVIFLAPTAAPGTIGISIRGDSRGVFVVTVIAGGPAEQAGLLAGDQITSIDGTPTNGIADAMARIRGAPNTSVSLTITRGGRSVVVQITRAS